MAKFSDLIGKTLVKVANHGNRRIIFICSDGTSYAQSPHKNCRESVTVKDVIGDLGDLIGSPILKAEKATSTYNIETKKGHVTIRWSGESNGYYSASVAFDSMIGINLRYDCLYGLLDWQEKPGLHPEDVMLSLGITYIYATPMIICDQWWFWGCKNVPSPLPPYLDFLNVDPMEYVGYGLPHENII